MINEVELFICDDCEMHFLGDAKKTEPPVCFQCGKEMKLVTFLRCKHKRIRRTNTEDTCVDCGEVIAMNNTLPRN